MKVPRQNLTQKKKNRLIPILILCVLFAIIATIIEKNLNKTQIMSEKQLIPRSVLFGNPDKVAVKISHDGQNTSYIAPHNGVLNIFLAKGNKLDTAKPITNDTHRGIRSYFWSYDNKHIVYSQDTNGDENHHLFSINIDTEELAELTNLPGAKAMVNSLSKNFPDYAVVMLNYRRKDFFDLHLLNIKNHELKLIYQNNSYTNLQIDEDFQIRFGTVNLPDGSSRYDIFKKQSKSIPELIKLIEANATESEVENFIQDIQDVQYSEFMTISPEDIYTTAVVGFSKDYEKIYMLDSRDRDKAGLFEFNISNNDKKLIFASDQSDIHDVIQDPITKEIQAVASNYAREKWKFFDPKLERTFKSILDNIKTDSDIQITSRSLDDKVWIVAVDSDTAPPQYYKVNTDTEKVEFLFSGDTKLSQYELSQMHPVLIKSRDNINLVSYLTLPKDVKILTDTTYDGNILKNVKTDKKTPLVVYVHGGPTARDEWGLDKTHQWLADRGYAVLSVNYRGSTGFGKDFINAGNGEWSGKMHDDIIDAANWAVSSGITMQDKIAIMGGSYGGYAALVGLTFTPEFFTCAIDIVGPSNLVTLLESIPPYWQPAIENLNRKIGGHLNTEEGKKNLMDRSPINFVDNICKPLLVAQGANDPRVKQAESDQIVNTMKAKNIPVIYALYPDEGHGFARPENRLSFYVLTEYFLNEHMGGSVEKVCDEFQGCSLKLEAGRELLPEHIINIIN